jgi:methionyl-tRNA formyltransferase
MAEKLSIVFLGSGPVAAQSLEFLADTFTIEAVITKPRPAHHKDDAPVEAVAEQKSLNTLFAGTRKELDELFSQHQFTSKLGVVVDYGVIISEQVIARFPLGIVNSHFSLLPDWRGADPITFSLLSGQSETGVSLMSIDAGLDTGALLTQRTLAINPTDTTPTLTNKLIALSNELLEEFLPKYANGELELYDQPSPELATYSRKLTKDDGRLDVTKPAAELEREIRAFTGWPKSRLTLGDIDTIITSAHVAPYDSPVTPGELVMAADSLGVVTSDGLLAVDTLQPAGKKEMPVQAFLLGYRSRL